MKNLLVLIALTSILVSCSPTRNDIKASKKHPENKSAYATIGNTPAAMPSTIAPASSAQPRLYASAKGVAGSNNDSLEKRIDLAQQEMMKKIDQDKAVSSENLKKVMTTKVYTTTTVNDDKTSISVADTLYSVKNGSWHAVE